jgi:hypothetical protein
MQSNQPNQLILIKTRHKQIREFNSQQYNQFNNLNSFLGFNNKDTTTN